MSSHARLRWQCRRGMRELDHLLLGWLESAYPVTTRTQKEAFQELLALPDPQLIAYLLRGEIPGTTELADLVSRIRDRTASE